MVPVICFKITLPLPEDITLGWLTVEAWGSRYYFVYA